MKTTQIQIPANVKWLNQVMTTLPHNSLLSKNHTGCGGTTIALTNNEDYIVCCPFISMIENKIAQSKTSSLYPYGILEVTGKTTSKEISDYMDNHPVKKVMVTYNSLHKLVSYSDSFSLLIDEYHLLFTNYIFRNEAVSDVLRLYRKFKSFCFMTATPLEDDFILEELKDIDKVELIWPNLVEVTVRPIQAENVSATTASLVAKFLSGEIDGNGYFFINSVEFINEMISACGLSEDNTRVIYSKSNKKRLSISKGKPEDEAKKINFITSTAWEGADFYDRKGRTIVISDSSKSHTMLDVSTSMKQVIGRIRDSDYISEVWHVFKNTRYSGFTSYESFKENVNREIVDCKNSVIELNAISERTRAGINVDSDSEYYYKKDNQFIFDPNRVKFDLWAYRVNHIYKTTINLVNEYRGSNLTCNSVYMDKSKVEFQPQIGSNFESLVKSVKAIWNEIYSLSKEPILSAAFAKYPFLQAAIEKLGFDGIEEAGYVITNIKRKLVNSDLSTSLSMKVFKNLKLHSAIKKDELIPTGKVKEVLSKIYLDLNLTKKPKASEILNYYEGSRTVRKVNGKSVEGFILIREKVIFANV